MRLGETKLGWPKLTRAPIFFASTVAVDSFRDADAGATVISYVTLVSVVVASTSTGFAGSVGLGVGTGEAVDEGDGVELEVGSTVAVDATVGDAGVTLGCVAGLLAWGLVAHPIAATQTAPNKTARMFISTPARLSPALTSEEVTL
jgi:hypothetical protein